MSPTGWPVVLLVDDEPVLTEGLRLALRREPIQIVTANSPRQGLEILRATAVDVVVADETTPQVSGASFLTRVRAEFPDVVGIVLASQASMEAAIMAIDDAQVFHFLTKPCLPADLMATITKALVAKEDQRGPNRRSRVERRRADAALDQAFGAALAEATMVYQPIVSASDRALFGFEALVRVNSRELPTPQELLRAATALNRRFDLDRAVRSLVANDLQRAPEAVPVFVNLLPESLGDERLLRPDDPLRPHAKRIVLEITERAPLDVIDDVGSKLDHLRAIGYQLALDDLGAGYSGLTSLATMQPEIVKFDRELISGIHRSTTKTKLVSAMVVVCQDLGALTLAEGIETEEELAHLHDLGCDLVQGYIIARPDASFSAFGHKQG
ncbi:MAG: EAL domain-containing response regulator [Actinomycetia bacterium]|nr:EAL domain-containing response regulator [Actinomycetes bacterium]